MKRFILFAGDFYYPQGGMDDFVDSENTLKEAKELSEGYEWAHVLDIETGSVVWTKV